MGERRIGAERGGEPLGGATALFVVELQNEALDVAELLVQVVADLSLLHVLRLVLHLAILGQDALLDVLKQRHNSLRNDIYEYIRLHI